MYIVCGMVASFYPQCARLCQAETSAENADLGFTFDEKTGTLSIYGKGMLGSVDKYNYSNYFQHELGFKDSLDKIRKVVIGDEITGIYESCFRFMLKKLEEVEIGANVAEIQKYAFLDCPSIRQITISPQNPYFKIVNHGLYSADGETLYLYPPALEEEKAVIASGTRKIREGVFACSRLKKITIPASVTALSDGMFLNCKQLEEVTFAKGSNCRQTMYSYAAGGTFEGCGKLKKLEFGEKFQWITPNAFRGCTSLKTVYLGKSFRGFQNFYGKDKEFFSQDEDCENSVFPALEQIRISPQNKIYRVKNNVVFSKNDKKLYYYPIARKGKSYKVPNSVTKIAAYAFYGNQNLQFVYTGKNTTTIGYNAFYSAKNLSSMEFDKKMRTLESECFSGCSKLKKIKNLDQIKSLEDGVLSGSQVYLIIWDDSLYDTLGKPGKTMTFYLPKSYRGKDIRWSVVSGKKHVKIAKKYAVGNKVTVKILKSARPKKPGKTTKSKVQAKVGKKKFFCEIICYAED